VQALHFVDTELLPRPVHLNRLRQLAREKGHTLVLRSAHKIDTQMFAAIYREGHHTP